MFFIRIQSIYKYIYNDICEIKIGDILVIFIFYLYLQIIEDILK